MEKDNRLVALITGASRGIGKAIAMEFATRGITTIGTATTQNGADQISEYLKKKKADGIGMELDVSEGESIERLFSKISEKFKEPTILVNNAGITKDNLLMRMKDDEWQSVIDTNLGSMYRVTKLCLRAMTKARWGRVVNISSVAVSYTHLTLPTIYSV